MSRYLQARVFYADLKPGSKKSVPASTIAIPYPQTSPQTFQEHLSHGWLAAIYSNMGSRTHI